MTDCLFCRIASGQIPAAVVHSDDRLLAFEDINPQAPLHVLVIPRAHHPTLAEVAAADPGLVGALVVAAQQIAGAAGFAESGYRLIANTGPDAGQTVFHAHLHVLAGAGMRLTLA